MELRRQSICLIATSTLAGMGHIAHASPHTSHITFDDIAADDRAGITYKRVRSARDEIFDIIKSAGTLTFDDFPTVPHKSRGFPGVALLDHDNDGDLDIYVTNGPGADNSLYSNQLVESGLTTFIDQAIAANVTLNSKDSHGVCFGDIDNDGDHDLLVINNEATHNLLENDGTGFFTDITLQSHITSLSGGVSCSMGDVNGDGSLDIAIANSFNQDSFLPILGVPFELNISNQLFVSNGDNTFKDVSVTSGILELDGIPSSASTITWAMSLVDYDLDGDVDIIQADDQAAYPAASVPGGIDRGYIQILENDGTGQFTSVTVDAGTDSPGQWMGLSFGDFNCDGAMDFFGSNFGDYTTAILGQPYTLGESTSRWFLGDPNEPGKFTDPGVGALVATPFGWGTTALTMITMATTTSITLVVSSL